MKTHIEIARLRWMLPFVIATDVTVTLIGQPASFWSGSGSIKEANPFFAWFLAKGILPFLGLLVIYTVVAFLLVSFLPRRVGLIAFYSFLFGHYFGASSWFMYYFQLGILAPILFGVLLAVCVVWLSKDIEVPNKSVP